MKKFAFLLAFALMQTVGAMAQGWPAQYKGVMLQSFYWDSFEDTQWLNLESQADELAEYFTLVWIPQSGNCGGMSMGYNPLYYWDHNSTFGTEAELRSLINTFKSKGIGTIADVVINHRGTLSNWVDFPKETYKGQTYQMLSTDICADDDGGKTRNWANQNGYQLSSNNDSGEGWDGFRDLDHSSANVQRSVNALEDFLLNDLGYIGFRYDVGKGFAAKYFGQYNYTSKPQFSVGEVWDSNDFIKSWISGTTTNGVIQSGAFDFQFRYRVRDAINNNDWTSINSSNCLIKDNNYKRYAVTFVENHDTEKRKDNDQDPIWRDTLAANAILLAMPGTPCVFSKHWMAHKKAIKQMIAARKLVGIHNQSTYASMSSKASCIVLKVGGTNGNLFVAVGPDAESFTRSGCTTILSGPKYKYLVDASVDISGWEATLKHIEETTKDPEPEQIVVPDFCTLLDGKVCAYFEAPTTWRKDIKCWCWDNGNTSQNYTGGTWPGTLCEKLGTAANGNTVWRWSYDAAAFKAAKPMIIFSNDGTPQTADLTFVNGGYYNRDGLQATVTASAIHNPTLNTPHSTLNTPTYNLSGQRVTNNYRGIVIQNGKKISNK